MTSQDVLQQLPVQGPFLKANILWETRITTVPATISMAHARDAEAESKVWRLLSFLLASLAGAAGGTL